MRQLLRYLVLLCLVVTLLPAAAALPVAAQPEAVVDEELVILTRDDRIVVNDPHFPSGYVALTWQSPQTGFRQVATGDFNGDGTAEIVGLRGGEAHVFDPYRATGESDVTTVFTATTGQTWSRVVTGKFFGGIRDGLVLMQTLGSGAVQARLSVFSFESPGGWTQVWSEDFGAPFNGLATGNVDGDAREELLGIRSAGGSNLMIIWRPAAGWATSFQQTFSYPFVFAEIGDIVLDSSNKDEIATTRSGVANNLNSFLVFRYINSTTLDTLGGSKFYPNFVRIALGDVTGNGDDEVYLLRPGVTSGVSMAALHSENFGSDSPIQFNELAGQTKFGNIQAGDTDGDGRAEVVVMSSNEYLIYTEPASSTSRQSVTGSFGTSLSFDIADLGDLPAGPRLSVSPTSVSLTVQGGQTATQAVQILNAGTGTLNWTSTVTQGASWLSIQPASGVAPTAATLHIDATSLAANTYTGTVRISGQSGVTGSPQDITVNLTVTAPPAPRLSVTPTAITLTIESGKSETRQIQIANTGAGTINWTASQVQSAPWLSFAPASGSVGTTPATLTATINAVDVLPGPYTGTIRIDGGPGVQNSPQDVTINLTVTAPPFSASPTSLSMTYIPPTTPGTRTVTVTGTGVSWHAGVVPMESIQRVQAAIDAGKPMAIRDGLLLLDDGGESVPVVDYVDVSPSSSTANQTGVTISLVPAKVPHGLSFVAVVFVANEVASPPAVVVRLSVLRTQPGATDLLFLPFAGASQ